MDTPRLVSCRMTVVHDTLTIYSWRQNRVVLIIQRDKYPSPRSRCGLHRDCVAIVDCGLAYAV
jgi:hypothetical protein